MNKSPYPVHPLRRWLLEQQESNRDFAARVGISEQVLSSILHWRLKANLANAEKLSAATGGAVALKDFIRPQIPPR